MSDDELNELTANIRAEIEEKGRCLLNQPAELSLFRPKSDDQLRDWAAAHGWAVVSHLGREQIEFFKAVPGQTV